MTTSYDFRGATLAVNGCIILTVDSTNMELFRLIEAKWVGYLFNGDSAVSIQIQHELEEAIRAHQTSTY